MSALEAQGEAARIVREMRGEVAQFLTVMASLRGLAERLDRFQPALSPAAWAEVDAERVEFLAQLAEAIVGPQADGGTPP